MSAISYDDRAADDPLRPLQRFCEVVPYCKTLGLYAYAVDGDTISLAMPPSPYIEGDSERHFLHAGAIIALVDSACGMAVTYKLRKPWPIATLDLRVDHLKPIPSDALTICEAQCYRVTKNIVFIRASVYIEGDDNPAAESMSSFMLLKPYKKEGS